MKSYTSGFTLIEIAIVLVIIGCWLGSPKGQELIHWLMLGFEHINGNRLAHFAEIAFLIDFASFC